MVITHTHSSSLDMIAMIGTSDQPVNPENLQDLPCKSCKSFFFFVYPPPAILTDLLKAAGVASAGKMAKLSRGLAAASSICVVILAATLFKQPDSMKDYSGIPSWLAFTFGMQVKRSKQLDLLTVAQSGVSISAGGTPAMQTNAGTPSFGALPKLGSPSTC